MKRTFPSQTSTPRAVVRATAVRESGVATTSTPTQHAILSDGDGWCSSFDQWGRGAL